MMDAIMGKIYGSGEPLTVCGDKSGLLFGIFKSCMELFIIGNCYGLSRIFLDKDARRYILPLYRKYIIIKSFNQLYVVKM